jgi:uncharacterized membrane protein YfcA
MLADIGLGWLFAAAACAGFVDAVVGGGGLIQVPALLTALPGVAPATIFGTNKLASIFGTGNAALRYWLRIALPWSVIVPAAGSAFVFSFIGASAVDWLSTELVRPLALALLVLVLGYTLLNPSLGMSNRLCSERTGSSAWWRAALIGAGLGFYDGFFGPGTGSFLIFVFVRWFGMDFLRASGSAKFVNLTTNAAALCYFVPSGYVLVEVGAGMAMFNIAGAMLGARLALRCGSVFVRRVFLVVSGALILRFA